MTAGVEDEDVDEAVPPNRDGAEEVSAEEVSAEAGGAGRDRADPLGADRGQAEGGPAVRQPSGRAVPTRPLATDPSMIVGSGPTTADGAVQRPRTPITVEQAYRARLEAAAAAPPPPRVPDARSGAPEPRQSGPEQPRPRPSPSDPPGSEGQVVLRKAPLPPALPPHLRARPRIEPEQGILGLSRHARSRLGSRLFNLFFVCVFALILVQMVVALLAP